ncbi:MAG: hypothetical protein ACFB20_05545 [Opitutales bacterium]
MTKLDKPTPTYERLSPRFAGGRERLYLASDHLLLASGRLTESYKRFYLKDILCITLVPTRAAGAGMVLFILASILSLLVVFLGSTAYKVFFGLLLIFFVWAAAVSILRFPSARMAIHTRVQWIRTDAVPKRAHAQALLQRLQPLLHQHQGAAPDAPSLGSRPEVFHPAAEPTPSSTPAPAPTPAAEEGAAPAP